MAREKTERVSLTVEKDGVVPLPLNGVTYRRIAHIEAEVTVEVTRANFKGSYDEPPDPDTSEVVDAHVTITFYNCSINGELTLTKGLGLDAFNQYWDHDELDSEAIEAADNDDDADFQYETQRELREELGGA